MIKKFFLFCMCTSILASKAWSDQPGDASAELISKANDIHRKILTLDTHVDIDVSNFTKEKNLGTKLENVQVDLPKMQEGGLGAAFFIVYASQGELTKAGYESAEKTAMEKFTAIHNMTNVFNKDIIEFANTPEDCIRIWKSGKKVAMIGVENAYPLGEDLSKLNRYYDLGARYVSLTHNGHNQFADANFATGNDPERLHKGLTKLGKELIRKLNKKGIMVDVSHASDDTTLQTIKLSKAPVIASHSAVYALRHHTRNLKDGLLKAIKKNGGVIQIVAFQSYLKDTPPGTLALYNNLAKEYGLPEGNLWTEGDHVFAAVRKLPKDRKDSYLKALHAMEKLHPYANVKDLVDHIDYAVKLIGIDHVGISSDFGGGGGIEGWSNAGETFNITLELVRRGYTPEQIEKLWSGNLLRVWEKVEQIAQKS